MKENSPSIFCENKISADLLSLAIETRDLFENKNNQKVTGNCEIVAVNFLFNLVNKTNLFNVIDKAFILRSYAESKDNRFIIKSWVFDSGAILKDAQYFYGVFFGLDREKEILKSPTLKGLLSAINNQTPGPWPDSQDLQKNLVLVKKPNLSESLDTSANKKNDIWDYDESLDKKIFNLNYSLIKLKSGAITHQKDMQSFYHS